MKINLNVKPLSVNECWQGKRFKTKKYKNYEKDVLAILPKITVPEGDLNLWIEYGLSSSQADIDNPTKPFLDILQKKYGFNDSRIQNLILKKTKVKKGEEYVMFNFI